MFYLFDNTTRRRKNLGTKSRKEAESILAAYNEAQLQPVINLQIAQHLQLRYRPFLLRMNRTVKGGNHFEGYYVNSL